MYVLNDYNEDGKRTTADRVMVGKVDPDFFGGLNNSFRYGNLSLQIFFEFKQVFAPSKTRATAYAGGIQNFNRIVLDSWKSQGDIAPYQKYTQGNSDAYNIAQFVTLSNLAYADLTYLRLKNIELFYQLPQSFLKRAHMSEAAIFLRGNNVIVFNKDKEVDPEMTNNIGGIPPLRTIAAGIQFKF